MNGMVIRRLFRQKQPRGIDPVELVSFVAKLAVHANPAVLFNHAANFICTKISQHVLDSFAAATAAKRNRQAIENTQIVFVKQAMQ